MLLEDTVKLKPGTKLVATHDELAPRRLTKGKVYVLIAVKPKFINPDGAGSLCSSEPRFPNQQPCSCDFEIEDDAGRTRVYHNSFKVV